MAEQNEATGKILQVMGPVIDVEFPPGQLPEIYNALVLSNPSLGDEPDNLVEAFFLIFGYSVEFGFSQKKDAEHILRPYLEYFG